MVPFPRLHFFSVAMAPLMSQQGAAYRSLKVPDLVTQMFSPGNVSLNTTCASRFEKKLNRSVPGYGSM